MERLQTALASARAKRGETTAASSAPADRAGPAKTPLGTDDAGPDAAWAALTPFVPKRKVLTKHLVVTSQASDAATPFDILRTKILLQMRQNNWTRIAITSPMPQSGKTTMACNLTLGMGRQQALRAMLFDMDLGEPSVHQFFEHKPEHSLPAVLTGLTPFADQAVRIGENISVAMTDQPESDPTKIMLANETEQKLHEIEERYKPDIMIFDLPSVLVGDNTRAFLKNVDCALIIARANATKYSQFDACEREVAEYTNVMGTILNAVPGRSNG